ncbi:MAG: glycerate kinase, partial [Solirubrobacterales bacterium]
SEGERDPLGASSIGTGELIADAVSRGARTVYVACGGSATTDGGTGALEAFDPSAARLVAICDTHVPFERAAEVFAPQKGADAVQVRELRRRPDRIAQQLPRDPRGVPISGGAGGISGALWAHGAELALGAPFILDALDFDRRLVGADLVITGEGAIDETTTTGKAPAEVATRARTASTPCHAIVGRAELDGEAATELGLASIEEAQDLAAITAAAARVARA